MDSLSGDGALTVPGVRYAHIRVGLDDLYLTRYAEPFRRQLLPDSFITDRNRFEANSQKLFGSHMRSGGTGTLYRQTRTVRPRGLQNRSWSCCFYKRVRYPLLPQQSAIHGAISHAA